MNIKKSFAISLAVLIPLLGLILLFSESDSQPANLDYISANVESSTVVLPKKDETKVYNNTTQSLISL